MRNVPSINLADYSEATLLRFIGEVKRHQVLYDIPRKDRSTHIGVSKRNALWRQLGTLFGLDPDECLSIWSKLRGTFTRYFKYYHKSKSSSTQSNPCSWQFFESLLFLIPYIEYAGHQPAALFLPSHQSHLAVSNIAKKALKRSKTLLMKSKENGEGNDMDLRFQPGGAKLKINVIHLVELVKQHPVIYSKTTAHNSSAKVSAWKAISQEIGAPPRACLTRWIYLWRKLQFSLRNKDKEKWVWYPVMEYFLPFLKPRSRLSTTNGTVSTDDEMLTASFGDMDGWNDNNSFVSEHGSSNDNLPHADETLNARMMKMEPTHVEGELHIIPGSPIHQAEAKDETSSGVSYWKSGSKDRRQFSEYNFGICTAEMLEDIPKDNRPRLKAKILEVIAGAM